MRVLDENFVSDLRVYDGVDCNESTDKVSATYGNDGDDTAKLARKDCDKNKAFLCEEAGRREWHFWKLLRYN